MNDAPNQQTPEGILSKQLNLPIGYYVIRLGEIGPANWCLEVGCRFDDLFTMKVTANNPDAARSLVLSRLDARKDIEGTGLRKDLAALLNRHSKENESQTPDYILADYLCSVLAAYELAVMRRDIWHQPPGPKEGKS